MMKSLYIKAVENGFVLADDTNKSTFEIRETHVYNSPAELGDHIQKWAEEHLKSKEEKSTDV